MPKTFKAEILLIDTLGDMIPVPGVTTIPFEEGEMKHYLEEMVHLAEGLAIRVLKIEEISDADSIQN